nr:proline-rich 33 kDa extensin-related protein-like [Procambarus clarkii]
MGPLLIPPYPHYHIHQHQTPTSAPKAPNPPNDHSCPSSAAAAENQVDQEPQRLKDNERGDPHPTTHSAPHPWHKYTPLRVHHNPVQHHPPVTKQGHVPPKLQYPRRQQPKEEDVPPHASSLHNRPHQWVGAPQTPDSAPAPQHPWGAPHP